MAFPFRSTMLQKYLLVSWTVARPWKMMPSVTSFSLASKSYPVFTRKVPRVCPYLLA